MKSHIRIEILRKPVIMARPITPALCRTGGLSEQAARHRHDQSVFHRLLTFHQAIARQVTEIEGGIEAVTRSDNLELVALIQDHARAMKRRMEEGFGLRHWDPAFVEIFAQAGKVRLEIESLPDGVRVRETSEDPNVTLLIRAHGAVVSAFVARGAKAAATESPLPEAYRRSAS